MLGLWWFGRSASYKSVMAVHVTIGGSDPVKFAATRREVWTPLNTARAGFIRRNLDLHRSEIDVTGLLEFVGF